jgi:hypothetical protein
MPKLSRTVYLVSYVGKKRSTPSRARDLYTSDWFVKARHYVEGTAWFSPILFWLLTSEPQRNEGAGAQGMGDTSYGSNGNGIARFGRHCRPRWVTLSGILDGLSATACNDS